MAVKPGSGEARPPLKLIATTVTHAARIGEPHGAVYLVDLTAQSVFKVFELDDQDIDWSGDDGGRGLRGIAIDGATLYLAAGDRLLAFSAGMEAVGCWQNPYLVDCRELSIYRRNLFLISAGNDSVLAFDLDDKRFQWGMKIQHEQFRFRPLTFDPAGEDGPLTLNKLQLRSVHAAEGGLYAAGLNTGGLLHFNGTEIRMSVELPPGAQDPRLFRNGVLFNDSAEGVLRYTGRHDDSEDRAMHVPFFAASDHAAHDSDAERRLRRGYARGLNVLNERLVAGGNTPAGLTLYDLQENRRLFSVNFTRDVRVAVNSIAPW